jgi:hypothetical protein
MTELDDAMHLMIVSYGARETLLALARQLQKEGLLPLAGKVRAMLPPAEVDEVISE